MYIILCILHVHMHIHIYTYKHTHETQYALLGASTNLTGSGGKLFIVYPALIRDWEGLLLIAVEALSGLLF